MAVVLGRDIGVELCAALGLPAAAKISRIMITADAGEAATVTITQFIETNEADGIRKVLSKYLLTAKEDMPYDRLSRDR